MKARWISIPAAALMILSAGQALADEALARKNGCMECHGVDKRGFVGPSFQEISARYKDKALARNALMATMKNGGKGNWPEASRGVPMPPYKHRIPSGDIERLVDWVLSLLDKNPS